MIKIHTIEPISIGGNRIESDCVAEVTPAEYLQLSKANAVEVFEVFEAKQAAKRAAEKAHAEAVDLAAKAEAEAKATAARLGDEAKAKAEGATKNDARKRAESAKPVAS